MCLYPKNVPIKKNVDGILTYVGRTFTVCGHCLECAQQMSYEWAFRLSDEAKDHERKAFITLTYAPEYYPEGGNVSKREVQLFMKRLRKEISPLRIRFFACGEYGSKRGRPHYHLLIFGYAFDDKYFWRRDGQYLIYRSPQLEKVWTKGHSEVADVSFDTCLYSAKYMNKYEFERSKKAQRKAQRKAQGKIQGKNQGIKPPFVLMSNRPGIGYNHVYNADMVADRIYVSGKSCKIPRYYLKVMERDGVFLDEFKERRQRQGEFIASLTDLEKRRDEFERKFIRPSLNRSKLRFYSR